MQLPRRESFGRPRRPDMLSRPPKPPSSSGLGHHPLKVATRVRIPLGVPAEAPGQRPRNHAGALSFSGVPSAVPSIGIAAYLAGAMASVRQLPSVTLAAPGPHGPDPLTGAGVGRHDRRRRGEARRPAPGERLGSRASRTESAASRGTFGDLAEQSALLLGDGELWVVLDLASGGCRHGVVGWRVPPGLVVASRARCRRRPGGVARCRSGRAPTTAHPDGLKWGGDGGCCARPRRASDGRRGVAGGSLRRGASSRCP